MVRSVGAAWWILRALVLTAWEIVSFGKLNDWGSRRFSWRWRESGDSLATRRVALFLALRCGIPALGGSPDNS